MKKNGFTLVELIAVILILGLIIVLVATNFFSSGDGAKKKLDELMQNQIKDALKIYSIDMKLKDCHNCQSTNLNVNCVTQNVNKNQEKNDCQAFGIEVSLGMLKMGNYFEDLAKHCVKYDNNKKLIEDTDIVFKVYRYAGEYYYDLNGITCRK